MRSIIIGLLSFNDISYELIFSDRKFNIIAYPILLLACISGSLHPFLSDDNLNFNILEFIIRFFGLLIQNLFIFAGTFFLGFIFFATNRRIDIGKFKNGENSAKLTFSNHARLLSIIQFPTIIGMVSIIPIIKNLTSLSFIILVVVTLFLYAVTVKSIFISFGYNHKNEKRRQVNFIKSFLIVIFTQIPGAMIFNLFIVNLALTYIS